MRFDKIDLNNISFSNRLNSYQFKLSQDIFGKRISLNLNRNEAAKLTGLTVDEYTKFEQGIDLKSSKEQYQKVLNKLSNFSKDKFFIVKTNSVEDKPMIQSNFTEKILEARMKDKLKAFSSYQIEPKMPNHSLQVTKRKSFGGGQSNVNTAKVQWIYN